MQKKLLLLATFGFIFSITDKTVMAASSDASLNQSPEPELSYEFGSGNSSTRALNLLQAIKDGNISTVIHLINIFKVSVTKHKEFEYSPLYIAIKLGKTEIADFLKSANAQLTKEESDLLGLETTTETTTA